MIATETAKEYIKAAAVAKPTAEQLAGFSAPYRDLAEAIVQARYGRRVAGPHELLQRAFGSTNNVNPWKHEEGERLADLLFGSARGRYIKDIWELLDRLPYQTGYQRKPYRTRYTQQYGGDKLERLQSLYYDELGGLPLADQLRYDVYQGVYGADTSYLYAVALKGPEGAALRLLIDDIVNGEDEIGGVTRSIIKALLISEDPRDWSPVEKLLLAAQQQEGLRQMILEALDETSIGTLRHFIGVLLEHDLARFSSVVRAVDVWFGFGWEAPKQQTVRRLLELAVGMLDDPEVIANGLISTDNLERHLALWTTALTDVDAANIAAEAMLQDSDRAKRVLALRFMETTQRTRTSMRAWMEEHFGEDLEADCWLTYVQTAAGPLSDDLFDRMVARANGLPTAGEKIEGTVFNWQVTTVTPGTFYSYVLKHCTEGQLERLGVDISLLPANIRESYMRRLFPLHYRYAYQRQGTEIIPLDLSDAPWKKAVMLQAVSDRSQSVMYTGLCLVEAVTLEPEDMPVLAGLLSRKGKELRGGLIAAVLKSSPARIEELVPILLASNKVDQRLAGLEILAQLHADERMPELVDSAVASYRGRGAFSKNEQVFLDKFAPRIKTNGLENGFGVIDYGKLRLLMAPQPKFGAPGKKGLLSRVLDRGEKDPYLFANLVDRDKAVREVAKLVKLIRQHADYEYTLYGYSTLARVGLVGDIIASTIPVDEHPSATAVLNSLPLTEVWQTWHEQSGLNDFELYALINRRGKVLYRRIAPQFDAFYNHYRADFPGLNLGELDTYGQPLLPVLPLIGYLYDARADHPTMVQFATDIVEDAIVRLPETLRTTVEWKTDYGHVQTTHWTAAVKELLPTDSGGTLNVRFVGAADRTMLQRYDLEVYLQACLLNDRYPPTGPALPDASVRDRPGDISHWLPQDVHERGLIGDDDLLTQALHGRLIFQQLETNRYLTDPARERVRATARRIFDPLRERLLDVEQERGDLASVATPYTSELRTVEGSHRLLTVLQRLGKETLNRGYSYGGGGSKKDSFSALVKKSVPGPAEEVTTFVEHARQTKIAGKRWLEVAMYAPQWAPWIAELTELPALESAVWWFHAHASDRLSKEKETIVAQYSGIDGNDLRRGAIDITWFYEVYGSVGKANWKLLHDASKYISDGNGHRQVKLYSSILLGEVKLKETLAKIDKNRDQIYVRGLGLVPLSKRTPEKDTLNRYEYLQRYLAVSKQYGNQRQESERQAVEIALDNLARTAGYDDVTRFSWVMEAESTRKIMDAAVVEIDDVKVELYIDEVGKAQIGVERKGKLLKDVPAKLRKDKRIVTLKENKTHLRKQLSRTRKSLEQAMNAATLFPVAELADIYRHPIVQVMLDQLVLVTEDGSAAGFWKEDHLAAADGKFHSIAAGGKLRIAHPYDLFRGVSWDQYQKLAFDRQLRQPFKQIFRELYVVTADERETKLHSNRYQDHQIQPKKAVALLRGRGWTVSQDEGLQRVDHQRGIIATMYAAADWFTPADVESPTIEQVAFYDRRTRNYLPVDQIDPLLFSEIMRDIDLVVSVAHVGGVDPEASHSTLEMRAALARESARLFKLDQVTVKERFIIIENALGKFSIHLGSGVVNKQGLQLSILAVQSQHRGRVFLPFVDDDPKSAEIISKMRLIARDKEIKDPTILAQLAK